MSALSDLLAARSSLSEGQVAHLQRLVGEWQLLSDLSFADLLLWVPVESTTVRRAATPGSCASRSAGRRPGRPPTCTTRSASRLFGDRAAPLQIALTEGRIFREADPDWDGDLPIRREAIPIRCDGPR